MCIDGKLDCGNDALLDQPHAAILPVDLPPLLFEVFRKEMLGPPPSQDISHIVAEVVNGLYGAPLEVPLLGVGRNLHHIDVVVEAVKVVLCFPPQGAVVFGNVGVNVVEAADNILTVTVKGDGSLSSLQYLNCGEELRPRDPLELSWAWERPPECSKNCEVASIIKANLNGGPSTLTASRAPGVGSS